MRWVWVALALVLVAMGVALWWLLSGPERPAPSGPAAVGTRHFSVGGPGHTNRWGAHTGEAREVEVRVWYPAEVGAEPRLSAADGQVGAAFGRLYGFPVPASDGSLSSSHIDAAVAVGSPRPVVVFSHGAFGDPRQNHTTMEELASHGFVVVSVGHTHEAVMTLLPDGRAIELDPGLQGAMAQIGRTSAAHAVDYVDALNALTGAEDAAAARDAAVALGTVYRRMWSGLPVSLDTLLQTRIDDLRRVLAALGAWSADPDHPQHGAVDMRRVALMGHSLGAYTVVHAVVENQIDAQAVVALDIPYFVLHDDGGYQMDRPPLSLYAERTQLGGGHAARTTGANRFVSTRGESAEVAGASHMNLSDMNFLPRALRFAKLLGPVDGAEASLEVNGAVRDFLLAQLGDGPGDG